jgi:hypothetical protein
MEQLSSVSIYGSEIVYRSYMRVCYNYFCEARDYMTFVLELKLSNIEGRLQIYSGLCDADLTTNAWRCKS